MTCTAKDNPFAVQRTDSIPFCFDGSGFADIDSFANKVANSNYRGAILGSHGNGKTTLLCDLHSVLQREGRNSELVLLPRTKTRQHETIARLIERGLNGGIMLLDGLERIPPVLRTRLIFQSRAFKGFIATTHRRGLLPTLIHCKTSPAILRSILRSLSLDTPEVNRVASSLLVSHRGNLRLVLRELYDKCAEGCLKV